MLHGPPMLLINCFYVFISLNYQHDNLLDHLVSCTREATLKLLNLPFSVLLLPAINHVTSLPLPLRPSLSQMFILISKY